jgi:uncharacterized Rmd1/YagE family protein
MLLNTTRISFRLLKIPTQNALQHFKQMPKNLSQTSRTKTKKKKLNSVAFSPQANYTDRATAACWRS